MEKYAKIFTNLGDGIHSSDASSTDQIIMSIYSGYLQLFVMCKSPFSTWQSFNWPGIFAAVFYGSCSASMAFANKALISSYNFDFPFLILLLQMVISVLIVEVLNIVGRAKLPPYSYERGRQFLIPSVCAALHSSLSLVALKGMNIPMYGALKRCTPIVNLILSVVVLNKPLPSCLTTMSIVVLTLGCLIAGSYYFFTVVKVFKD